ncbi:BTAD domain-containing putative transcriptional regulator [Streptomyces sp. BI20]|uniref:AfsR/SARP family transcriptional regulator n=1 Tax=Streptomyces sp. BI20 TaxID=3403460 RepID=UPI003C749BB7
MTSTGPRFAFRLLGPLAADVDGQPLALGSPQQQALLVTLLLRRDRTAPLAELVAALWGEHPPARAAGTVRTYVSRLRAVLEPDRPARAPAHVLVAHRDGYALRLPAAPATTVDAEEFSAARVAADRHARAGRHAAAHDTLDAALALWRGPALPGLPGPAAEHHRQRLEHARLLAAEDRLAHALDADPDAADRLLPELRAFVAAHPLRERAGALLVRALGRTGRADEARAAHAAFTRVLAEELGTAPGAELTAAARALPRPHPTTAPGPPALPVGRDREEAHLWSLLRPDPPRRTPSLVVLTGLPGIGKTTLALHAAHRITGSRAAPTPAAASLLRPGTGPGGRADGRPREDPPPALLHARLSTPEGRARPAAEVLAELLSAQGVPPSRHPGCTDQRAALHRTLTAARPTLLLLDDAITTTDLLPLLPAGAACAVLVTSRARDLLIPGADTLHLGPLPIPEALALLSRSAPDRFPPDTSLPPVARALARLCAGHPEALRAVADRLTAPGGPTPARLLALLLRAAASDRLVETLATPEHDLGRRLTEAHDRLPGPPARVLRVTAARGPALFDRAGAAALTGLSDPGPLLDLLVDAGLLDSEGPDRHRYHPLLRAHARTHWARPEHPDTPRPDPHRPACPGAS